MDDETEHRRTVVEPNADTDAYPAVQLVLQLFAAFGC
jgi:hypothetical protein